MQSQPESHPQRNSLAVLMLCGAALFTVTIGLDQSPLSVVEPETVLVPDHRQEEPGVRISKGHYLLINPTSQQFSALRSNASNVEILQLCDIPFDGEEEYEFPPELHETISSLHTLRTLIIQIDDIDNKTIETILGLPNLQCIVFYHGGKLDDDGLLKLATHPELKLIGLWRPVLTTNAIDRFRVAAPHIQLEFGEYNRYGDVFDQNGCLNSRFVKAWFR